METLLSFVRSYFIFLLLLQIISYLTPKESYKRYANFFTGALLAALLLKPVLGFMNKEEPKELRVQMNEVMEELEKIQSEGKEMDMFEIFFMGEDTR